MATPIPQNDARFTLEEVARITCGRLVGAAELVGVQTDTRAALEGGLFVALRGERFDGHTFIEAALRKGAAAVLAEELPVGVVGVEVPCTLTALGQLAREHRRRWGEEVIAVAGSAGKTTTRSIAGALLSRLLPGRVHLAAGNLNNRVGVPMVLLGLQAQHEWSVVEIGTNQTGEVGTLAAIAEPDVSVLTLIDLEHTQGLGGIDDIEREEAAIFHSSTKLAVGNGDDPRVRRQLARCGKPSLGYGFESGCDYRILAAELTPRSTMQVQGERRLSADTEPSSFEFETPFLGEPGALASVAGLLLCERALGRPLERAWFEQALRDPSARQPGRLEPRELSDGTLVIDDSYNANPASVRAAIGVASRVAQLRNARLHLVLGEMRELGEWAEREHRALAAAVAAAEPDSVVAIAGDARWIVADAPRAHFFETAAEAAAHTVHAVGAGDVVLVKASRGVHAELVVEALERARGVQQ